MTPNRPYLLRALYEWILDNGMTPHLLIDTTISGTRVPAEDINNNRIVLNISPDAVHELVLGNEEINFNARFGGKSRQIHLPINSVTAIYARENGQGLLFPAEQDQDALTSAPEKANKPHLKVIK